MFRFKSSISKSTFLSLLLITFVQFSFAQEAIPKDTFISLEVFPGSLYFGEGMKYKLTISANGTVVFKPYLLKELEFVPGKVIRSRISQVQLKELLQEFEKINFFSLKDEYGDGIRYTPSGDCVAVMTDATSVNTSITINGKTKTVNHYHGCIGTNVVKNLTQLEENIEKVVNTKQLIEKMERSNKSLDARRKQRF